MKKHLALPPPEGSRRRAFRWLLGLGAVVVLMGVSLGWFFESLQPVVTGKASRAIPFEVKRGDTLRDVATRLRQHDLIRNAWTFLIYARFLAPHAPVQAGLYKVSAADTPASMLSIFQQGKIYVPVIKVTFPQGFTAEQMAERLQSEGVCSAASFMKAAQSTDYNEPFVRQISKSPLVKTRLEGYLYPNTYDFYKGESAHDIVNELLQEFAVMVTPKMMRDIRKEGETLPEIITEASLIEKEAYLQSDKPLIASVIDNRLKRGMPLQIDATLEYVLGYHRTFTIADEQAKSPYNTYLHYGLPPGPIANPGIHSIEAAIHPAHTDYYYYVAKYNGTGGHYFAKTYAQQLRNEQKSEQNYRKLMEKQAQADSSH